jgi:hypothetical protein
MGGISEAAAGAACTATFPDAPSALLAPTEVGLAIGIAAPFEPGAKNHSTPTKAKTAPNAAHFNGQRLGENSMGPDHRLGL